MFIHKICKKTRCSLGKIYTFGNIFTQPSVVTVATNFKSATTITTSTTDILRSTELLSSTARVVKVSITSEIHMRLKNCFLHTFISYQYLGDLPCVEALTDSAHNTAYWASNANTRSKLFLKSFTTPTSRKWGRSSNNIRNKNLTLPRKFKGCAPKLRKAKWE